MARYLYDPFGNLVGQWGSLAEGNRYRFSSKAWQAQAGLSDYGFRFYEPNMQRWRNPDPLREAGGLNLYAFPQNDPLNQVDPDGRNPLLLALALLLVSATSLDTSPPEPPPPILPQLGAGWPPGTPTLGPPRDSLIQRDFLDGLGARHLAGSPVGDQLAEVTATALTAPLILSPVRCLSAAKTGGQPLFRAVTDAELQSIQNLNRFSTVPGSSTPIPGRPRQVVLQQLGRCSTVGWASSRTRWWSAPYH